MFFSPEPAPGRRDSSFPGTQRRTSIEHLEPRRLLAAPIADAGGPYTLLEGQQLNLDASGSSDADGDIASYVWTINGQVQTAKTAPALTLTWGELQSMGLGNGTQTYNVSVKVIDLTSQETSDGTTLTINNAPPDGRLSVTPPLTGFKEGNSVTINSFVQFDWNAVPGASYTYQTQIKLNGVVTHTRSVTTALSTGDTFLYQLPDDGALEVRTTITDSEGASALATVGSGGPSVFSTSVADVPVTLHAITPEPTDVVQGQPFFAAAAASAAGVDTLTYEWTLDRFDGSNWVNELTEVTLDSFKEFTPISSGSYRFNVQVSDGDGGLSPQDGHTFTVAPSSLEAADIAYTGQLHFTTSSATDDTADVTLRATLVDGDGGDITRATVTFFNTETLEVYASGVPVTALAGTAGAGFATTSFSVALAENPDFLHISAQIDSGGAYDVATANAIVSLSMSGDAKIKAGGALIASSSSGLMGAAPGTEIRFSVNSHTQPVSGQIAGGVELVYSSYRLPDGTMGTELRTYLVTSTAVNSISAFVDGGVTQAAMIATVNIYDTTNRKKKDYVLVHSGMTLEMGLIDAGSSGAGDRIAVCVWNGGSGDMLFSSSWDGLRASDDLLSSGDISITRVS